MTNGIYEIILKIKTNYENIHIRSQRTFSVRARKGKIIRQDVSFVSENFCHQFARYTFFVPRFSKWVDCIKQMLIFKSKRFRSRRLQLTLIDRIDWYQKNWNWILLSLSETGFWFQSVWTHREKEVPWFSVTDA